MDIDEPGCTVSEDDKPRWALSESVRWVVMMCLGTEAYWIEERAGRDGGPRVAQPPRCEGTSEEKSSWLRRSWMQHAADLRGHRGSDSLIAVSVWLRDERGTQQRRLNIETGGWKVCSSNGTCYQ